MLKCAFRAQILHSADCRSLGMMDALQKEVDGSEDSIVWNAGIFV